MKVCPSNQISDICTHYTVMNHGAWICVPRNLKDRAQPADLRGHASRNSGTRFGQCSLTHIGADARQDWLGKLHIRWQPVIQGNMGYLQSSTRLEGVNLHGATNEFTTVAVEFGGGVRLWTTERLSFSPTITLLVGRTDDDYVVSSASGQSTTEQLRTLGLIDWNIETWSPRPALNIQYILPVSRTLATFSSEDVGFFTHGFSRSNVHLRVGGDSGFVTNKIDLDIPLAVLFFGQELHTGGFLSRTDLLGDLRQGLDVQHLNELHGRMVLAFRDHRWGMEWFGIGASYMWGTNLSGWTIGTDIQFHF